ncbi:hypothetical protein B0J13DRAFT_103236 [Dactylonectria estremocensis]|uniref:Zn(2)-C6 fungal-type domain-containing protein n=1 Tax=Dactylonectria estremocensis TaxID=1079267 RepID=A0A9P9E6C2_9HYPO|nr:hypothetical protein B0J13DRAFT_103236 [Dactylonectria estremocensis]
MVYCGKPSKGCSNCRDRKIRCDQTSPSCGQCVKRHQTCPGYRNQVDLMFRDENSHVISRARKTRSRPQARKKGQIPGPTCPFPSPRPAPSATPTPTTKAPAACDSNASVFSALNSRSSTSPSQVSSDSNDGDIWANEYSTKNQFLDQTLLGEGVSPSLQDQGISFFWARYVATDNGCYQNYSFIYNIWKPPDLDAPHEDAVAFSMTAVGLAGLSQQLTDPARRAELVTRSIESYTLAARLMRLTLDDPVKTIKDTTLLAVLILGIYESITGRSPQTMRRWQNHLKAASEIAERRGPAQFGTDAGARMFIMLSQSVLISCIQSDLPIPTAMVDLRGQFRPSGELDGPAWRLVDPVYRTLQVRADIKSGKLHDINDIVEKLTHIDDEFALILSELPPPWQYRRIQLTQTDPRVLGRWCYVYSGLLQATAWNGVRAIRILLLETILKQLCRGCTGIDRTSLSDPHQKRLERTVELLGLLGEAIVASVPQHFGVVSFRDGAVSSPTKEQRYRVMSPMGRKPSTEHGHESQARAGKLTDLELTELDGHEDKAEHFMTVASASHTIIWPLYVLGMSSSCSVEKKRYAISRLHAIHHETGLEQARVVAKMLQSKEEQATKSATFLDNNPPTPEGASPEVV